MKKFFLKFGLLIALAFIVSFLAAKHSANGDCFNFGYTECHYIDEQIAALITTPGFVAAWFIQNLPMFDNRLSGLLVMILVNTIIIFLILLLLKFLAIFIHKKLFHKINDSIPS